MVTISVKSMSGERETVEKFLIDGLNEEKKRIEFALETTTSTMNKFEEQYGISTSVFIDKFKKGDIEENDETFVWWAETKLAKELKEKLKTITDIEICKE